MIHSECLQAHVSPELGANLLAVVRAARDLETREERAYAGDSPRIHDWPEYAALRTALAILDRDGSHSEAGEAKQ